MRKLNTGGSEGLGDDNGKIQRNVEEITYQGVVKRHFGGYARGKVGGMM